jgi:hypothetical protein
MVLAIYKSYYSGTCLIWHTKGPGKCVGLYRMSEYSGFILVNRISLGPYIFVGCHRIAENSGSTVHLNKTTECLKMTTFKIVFTFGSSFVYKYDQWPHESHMTGRAGIPEAEDIVQFYMALLDF